MSLRGFLGELVQTSRDSVTLQSPDNLYIATILSGSLGLNIQASSIVFDNLGPGTAVVKMNDGPWIRLRAGTAISFRDFEVQSVAASAIDLVGASVQVVATRRV